MTLLGTRRRAGIEKIRAYPCSAALDFRALAAVRGENPDHPTVELLMDQRGVNPCWEDPITMAVNAARGMLSPADIADIELLVVGTESSPDQAKPMSTFVHRFLELGPNCRNFETKHACYSGTAALMTAAHWVASGAAPGKKALVIGSDQSRMNLGERFEYVMGAGAVAMLVSEQCDVVEIELETSAYWTKEVGDTFRPTSKEEAGNTQESLYCYLEGLDGAYEHFKRKNGFDYDATFAQHVYHVPFSAMSHRAHRAIVKRDYRWRREAMEASFARKVLPSLTFSRRFGGIYSAATAICLMGALDRGEGVAPGDRISIFSYGSGSCAEMYSVRVGPKARERLAEAGLEHALDARFPLTVAEYEALERERWRYVDVGTYEPPRDAVAGLYDRHYAGKGLLVLEGLAGHFRSYRWS
jgi:hydroxymethylglutaryl-CoA synthase